MPMSVREVKTGFAVGLAGSMLAGAGGGASLAAVAMALAGLAVWWGTGGAPNPPEPIWCELCQMLVNSQR